MPRCPVVALFILFVFFFDKYVVRQEHEIITDEEFIADAYQVTEGAGNMLSGPFILNHGL